MAIVAQRSELLEPLRAFVRDNHPVWGSQSLLNLTYISALTLVIVACAGMILLADEIVGGAKQGGQDSIGGIPMRVVRNQWGRQVPLSSLFDHSELNRLRRSNPSNIL